MNSKQRVQAALQRRGVDRVPVWMWYHPATTVRLASLLQIPPASLPEAMGDDVRQAWVNNNYAMEGIVHEQEGGSHVDAWGIGWTKVGAYNQITHFPLGGASEREVLAYRFPVERQDELLGQMLPLVPLAGRYFIGCDVSPCVFEMYWRLRGMEDVLRELVAAPALTATMFGRCADFATGLAVAACDRYPLDWLWAGDDVASQLGLLMSPTSWRALVKPELARVFAAGRARGLPVAFHCCGALRPIIGDLVEIGMDVLNPVQANCPGMDPLSLRHEFGPHLTLMGGVDTQDLLPNGTADEVRRAVAHLIEGLDARQGGYILAASHSVPPETPLENVFAMYAEAGISREEIFDRAAGIRARRAGMP